MLAEMEGKGITPVPTDPAALGLGASAAAPLAATAADARGEPAAAAAAAAAEAGPAAEAGEDARLASAEAREKGNACFKKKQWEQVRQRLVAIYCCVPVATDRWACRCSTGGCQPVLGLLPHPSMLVPVCRAVAASLPAGGGA